MARDHVLNLLWPDLERSAAQQTLRSTLHSIRKTLGPVFSSGDETLALDDTVFVDARVLKRAVEEAYSATSSLVVAFDAYQGDFLLDFLIDNNEGFAHWLDAEREYFRQAALRVATLLARRFSLEGSFDLASNVLDRALTIDPFREELQRELMLALYRNGDRAAAVRRYEQFRTLLEAELGVPPTAESSALYDAIITDSVDTRPFIAKEPAHTVRSVTERIYAPDAVLVDSHSLPFVGRERELAALRFWRGGARLLLVEGEPGIGKSRLVTEFLTTKDGVLLVGTAYELEQHLPYQPLVAALRQLAAHPAWPALRRQLDLAPLWWHEVARLAPELDGQSSPASALPADETRLWEGLRQFFSALARHSTVTLFLDDLQWADAATLALLGYLLRHAEERANAFIAATRAVETRSALATLLASLERDGHLERVVLERLSPLATHALAQQLSPVFAWPLADWLERSGEGSPYMIAELVQHARDQRLLRADGTLDLTAFAATPVVPQTIVGLIRTRIAQLSPDARRVLDAAAVIGREFEFEVVTEAALLNDEQAVDALEELHRLRLVRPADGLRYSLDHSLTLEVVQRELSAPRLRLLHRRVAEAMEAVHRHTIESLAGTIAFHFAVGGATERSAHYALLAGRQAIALAAWREAIGFYQLAIEGLVGSGRHLAQVLLGEAQFNAGELAAAEVTLRAVLAEAAANEQRNAARLALARVMLVQTRLAEAVQLARAVEGAQNSSTAIGARFIIGTALSLEGDDLDQAESELQAAAAALADTELVDNVTLQAQVVFELGNIAAQRGDLVTAVQRYHTVLALGDAASDDVALEWRILGRNNLAYHLYLLGDPTAANYLNEGMQIAITRGRSRSNPTSSQPRVS
ncbi:AAA family ATPase [Candidatus Gracilibacteria bacterium]|nr:AAA family ATPase [Candidatus Gracilibacteria bacterium]